MAEKDKISQIEKTDDDNKEDSQLLAMKDPSSPGRGLANKDPSSPGRGLANKDPSSPGRRLAEKDKNSDNAEKDCDKKKSKSNRLLTGTSPALTENWMLPRRLRTIGRRLGEKKSSGGEVKSNGYKGTYDFENDDKDDDDNNSRRLTLKQKNDKSLYVIPYSSQYFENLA